MLNRNKGDEGGPAETHSGRAHFVFLRGHPHFPGAIAAREAEERKTVRNVLFVCSQNKLRSPTAEQVFASWPDIDVSSAGTNNDAENPLSAEEIGWADIIFVMEKVHRSKVQAKFRSALKGKRLICLDIPDNYAFMDPALVQLLKTKVPQHL